MSKSWTAEESEAYYAKRDELHLLASYELEADACGCPGDCVIYNLAEQILENADDYDSMEQMVDELCLLYEN